MCILENGILYEYFIVYNMKFNKFKMELFPRQSERQHAYRFSDVACRGHSENQMSKFPRNGEQHKHRLVFQLAGGGFDVGG